MKVSQIIKKLENSDNYLTERVKVSEEFIEMVKVMLPDDYERIKTKEEKYQEQLDVFNKLKLK